jgi:hypothetical protein
MWSMKTSAMGSENVGGEESFSVSAMRLLEIAEEVNPRALFTRELGLGDYNKVVAVSVNIPKFNLGNYKKQK